MTVHEPLGQFSVGNKTEQNTSLGGGSVAMRELTATIARRKTIAIPAKKTSVFLFFMETSFYLLKSYLMTWAPPDSKSYVETYNERL